MVIRFDKELKSLAKLEKVELENLNLKESWLQDLVVKVAADIVGEPLLVIMRESKGFDSKERPDVMAVDKEGNLVIIELKRGQAAEDAATQAVKYAAYCHKLNVGEIIAMFRHYASEYGVVLEAGGPREALIDFLEGSEGTLETLNRKQRIMLVANNFDGRVFAVASWLSLNRVDIRCISLNMYQDASGDLLLYPEQLLPPQEITRYRPHLPQQSTVVSEEVSRDGEKRPLVDRLNAATRRA